MATKRRTFWATDEEWALLVTRAFDRGTNVSGLIRSVVLHDHNLQAVPRPELASERGLTHVISPVDRDDPPYHRTSPRRSDDYLRSIHADPNSAQRIEPGFNSRPFTPVPKKGK